jgi:protein involved in polysaccharide export with SLBB domain
VTAFFRSIFCYGIWICLLALLALDHSGYAQFSGSSSAAQAGLGMDNALIRHTIGPVATGDVFFEGPINPDDYIVGPGDRLDIVFWQPNFTENPVSVNAEGGVVIPYVGVVSVANLSLTQARLHIEDAVTQSMRVGRVTVSLIEPRHFRVNVTGLVENPGTYVVPATARVADAISMAGGLKRTLIYAAGDTSFAVVGSSRRIELTCSNGSSAGLADLMLFEDGGQLKANPRLQDGMTLHVPYVQASRGEIGVFGAVHKGGMFEGAPDDNVGVALALAGGLTGEADSSTVSVVSPDGIRTNLDLRGGSQGTSLAHPLEAGSRVYVAGFPDTTSIGSVTLQGEVAHPGGYPIVIGQTTLREVLDQAGGLRPTAAANSARLLRKVHSDPVDPLRVRVLQASLMTNPVTRGQDDAQALEFAMWDQGTVVLDLTGVAKSGSADKVTLQDGDVLEVPKSPLGVRVLGAVNHAGEVAWSPGQNLNYYLSQAGGINHSGWKSRAMVRKARNGSQIQYESSLPIDPGDVVFVPTKMPTPTWDVVKDVIAVTAQVATVVLIIQNIKK